MNRSIIFMIAMVGVLLLGLGGLLWFAVRKQSGKPAYQPEGKIRWNEEESKS